MVCAVTKNNERIPVYVNEARNSYRSFRPIHLKFQKESTQTNIEEGARLEAEMNELLQNPYISDDFPHLKVKFIGFLTMIDGKVSNILTEYIQCFQLYIFSSQKENRTDCGNYGILLPQICHKNSLKKTFSLKNFTLN